jgi:hypothetical protein
MKFFEKTIDKVKLLEIVINGLLKDK